MQTIATDASNDIFLNSKGFLALAQGREATADIALHNVRVLAGEDDLNTLNGVPYFDVVFNDVPDIDLFTMFATAEIEKAPGVLKVTAFETEIKDNILKYSATIKLENGEEVQING